MRRSSATSPRSSDERLDDALATTVNQLTAAIAAQLQDAGNVDHVRMLLRRMFTRFTLRADGDELVLVPELRPDALEQLLSADHRAALSLQTAYDALTT